MCQLSAYASLHNERSINKALCGAYCDDFQIVHGISALWRLKIVLSPVILTALYTFSEKTQDTSAD